MIKIGWLEEYEAALARIKTDTAAKASAPKGVSSVVRNGNSSSGSVGRNGGSSSNTSAGTGTSKWMQEYNEAVGRFAQNARTSNTPVSSNITNRMTVNSITPTGKKKPTWLQKGALEDGFSLENITKAILGTGTDFLEDVTTGLVGVGEQALDGLMGLAPYFYKSQFNEYGDIMSLEQREMHDKVAEDMKKELAPVIAKDLYDENAVAKEILSGLSGASELANSSIYGDPRENVKRYQEQKEAALDYMDNEMEKDSVLGEKSDALVQSAGKLAAQKGLQLVGVPWFVTSGVTTFGSEMETGLNEGATHDEAAGSAAVSAGAEVLGELLFGGDFFTDKTAADIVTPYLATAISNKALRAFVKFGLDTGGEAAEEGFSQFMSRLGTSLYKEENLAEILFSEEAIDEYIESMVGGAILGGAMNTVNAVQSKRQGVDFTTGLPKELDNAVDEIYNEFVSEMERDRKLTAREKRTIYDRVLYWVQNEQDVDWDESTPVEETPPVEPEIEPVVEEVQPVTEVVPPKKRFLYTGSPNTDIKQFKVGGVDGSRQTGDRYGRGIYLTTNENTAKNYAGDSGRVYQISADDLNIFNLNDTITPEMRDSLISVFKGGDTQFRNSMLRNFRTQMTFNDFESAEAFFSHQRKVWKEQDGEYAANKPEIIEADNETGRAVIEFTDFENWESNIETLTGNHLYDALKSLSTDDFSSFITGHGFDGIAFDEDADNQQYVIYRNEDRLRIDDGDTSHPVKDSLTTEEAPTVSKTETVEDAPVHENFSAPEVAVAENETTTDNPELQALYDHRQVLTDTIMSRVEVDKADETTDMLASKWRSVDSRIRSLEAQESNPQENPLAESDSSSRAEEMVRQFVKDDYGEVNESKTFEADGFTVRRELTADEKRWTYTITSPNGTQRKGSTDVDLIDFWDSVSYNLSRLIDSPEVGTSGAIPAEAPVRVVPTDNGDYLVSDKTSSGEQKWQSRNKTNPKMPRVLTEQPPVQPNQKSGGATNKTNGTSVENVKIPKITDALNIEPNKVSPLKWLGEHVIDHGFWVERLSKQTGNRELDAKWNFIRNARGGAQHLIGKGSEADGVKSLKSMLDRVDKAGLTQDFYNYMHHWLNYDRMTVEDRYPNSQNRGVFGQFPASESLKIVQQYEQSHPEFKAWAEDVYAYNRFLRNKMVEAGIITKRTAALWEEMFPHYVPIRRVGVDAVYDQMTARKAGFKAPVYEFEGSNKDILPMFDTMAQRTLAVYRATAMNGFASELYNTLYPGYAKNGSGEDVPFDYFLDGFDPREELIKSGELGSLPTMSFYLNGKRHTFDINSEMYESLKPASDWLSYKVPGVSQFSNIRRALITEYNPWFVLKNFTRDIQDVVINSQHPLETYANLIGMAPMEMVTKGQYYQEYLANGGEQNSYFDNENVSFDTDSGLGAKLKKITGLELISKANNIVEMLPRFAEYIASREAGRSIEESMLDASRVTTNFAAGGDLTKFANRNGATFLNASVQGFVQQARNIVEAKQNGLKGWAGLAARYAVAGIPHFILNDLIWDDDEEYQELPDYITNNYYIVGKYGDGKFYRLPKGRTAAVIQNAVEQVSKMSSGDDEADWEEFFRIFVENIAPNNPGEDNVFAPIRQVMKNETWYGEDLVSSRLQDLPVTEQFDEKTDSISIWLSEKLQDIPGLKNLELSPKQINYLLDQYSGVVGDTVLPFFTPKAESSSDSFLGKAVAPLRDIFTTDSVLNNRVTGDFYDTLEAAEAQAESENASITDKLRSGILISANVEISRLMQEQRDIQTSDLPDSEKYKRNRELKEEINDLQRYALDSLKSVLYDGNYAEAGDKRFNYSEEDDTWWQVKPELANGEDNWYYIQEQLSHDKLGMSYADFWNGRQPPEDFEGKTYYAEYNGKRYNYDTEDNTWYEIRPQNSDGEDNWYYQQEQLAHDKLGVSYEDFWNNREAYIDANYVAENWGEPYHETVKNVIGTDKFTEFAGAMGDIKADYDNNGNAIKGSRKRKMEEFIYSLDIPEAEKHILFKLQYPYTNTNNYSIINYLNDRDDISYEEMVDVLEEMGFDVDSNGNIRW